MLRPAVVLLCIVTHLWSAESADDTSPPAKDGNRLAYLDECNPWYPHKDFPKLITPQWVGEEGVEAVIVLAIDDMRDPAKYEQYLRPILNRLKQIDGRAPVSIMTNEVKPDDPQLQSWLGEGLSIECHTIDHPCPILQGGDFAKAKSTYDRCVDLMGTIPGNKPVAFRTPCCDSLNTVSPRFFAEILNSATEKQNFLQIDSSVMHFFTSEDETLPKELVLDENGNERFWKYKVRNLKRGDTIHDNFVNYIKNYPYPYVINNSCWEIPCLAPSDWSAQHLHGINNPVTIEDWKAAIDLTVHKQGCFSLVFHPHGWIKPEQVVEMIDHAVAKHGKKVKFLNFREAAERLNRNLIVQEIPNAKGAIRNADMILGLRFEDLNSDGVMDLVYGNKRVKFLGDRNVSNSEPVTLFWSDDSFRAERFPFVIDCRAGQEMMLSNPTVLFFNSAPDRRLSVYRSPPSYLPPGIVGTSAGSALMWTMGASEDKPVRVNILSEVAKSGDAVRFLFFRDLDHDGISEAIGYVGEDAVVFKQVAEAGQNVWKPTALQIPQGQRLDAVCLADIDLNGIDDLVVSSDDSLQFFFTKSFSDSWIESIDFPNAGFPFVREEVLSLDFGNLRLNNGFFIRDRHFCWINEDTATLPDLMYRVSFDEVLAEHKKASGSASILRGNHDGKAESGDQTPEAGDSKSEISNLKSHDPIAAYDPVPIGAAVVDITPDYPVRLTGYGNRMKESEGVAAKIHARALVIGGPKVAVTLRRDEPPTTPHDSISADRKSQTADQTKAALAGGSESSGAHHAERDGYVVLITVDNCGVPIEITDAVYDRISARHNIPRERFAISSTHTHSGPWLRGFAPNIFAEIPDDHGTHLAQYEKDLIEKLIEVVEKAIAAQRPGHLSLGFGEAGFAMNRRLLKEGKWSGFGEVPDGPTDKRVPVLAAHDVEGKLIAVLASYACHCTTETGEFNQISGDWAGFAADMLETDHPGAVALIAIGCGADANPSPRGTHEQAKVHGRTIADEVTRILASGRASALRDRAQWSPLPRVGGEGQGEGAVANDLATSHASSPLIRPSATFSPDLGGEGILHRINPVIICNMARIDLPLGPIPSRETWEQQAKEPSVTGSRARYFLQMLDDGKEIPTTIPDYPVQTWCFGEDLAMVFLGGEVVVDYSIRMNDMFDGDRLWINAYSNDVPCYIASARVLREGGYECDSSMLYYRRPTRLAPEAEDVLCDAVQKIMPHVFYSEKLQQDFPAPKSPEESLKTMTTKPDLRVVLAASEPLIRDPVAFDWDERGRLWVVEMGDYPSGENVAVTLRRDEPTTSPPDSITPAAESQGAHRDNVALGNDGENSGAHHAERDGYIGGRVQMLEDTDKDGVYDKATTFLDGLAFPNGIHCWRGGVIITMAPEIFYAEDTDGDGKADVRETMYKGFVEGNQQHRINGLRWGLDGWLYLANGDSGGEIAGTGFVPGDSASGMASALRVDAPDAAPNSENKDAHGGLTPNRSPVSLRGRDLRISPDTNELDTVSGQTQFGRERDDFGNWFGNNNSNPIWQYVLEDRYVRRNPHAGISQVTAPVSMIPGAAPVYPTSRTLARFNDFAYANRFTSACSTMIYRDNYLGEQYYGNAFTSEPVHNLVSRLVLTRDGYGFIGERAADEQQSEFLASSDNWFRPTMIRTGPDGALWIADMYRAVIEHPEWIPPEYQRKMNLYAGSDRGRIYRIVPASECCGENVAVTLRRDEPTTSPRDASTSVAESQAVDRTQAAAVDGRKTLGAHHAERDGYFDQPWNEIPIADLVKRLESPNGWWRDTAQRILTHRRKELLDKDWLPEQWIQTTPQAKVQIAASFSAIMDLGARNQETHYLAGLSSVRFLLLLKDADPRVRQATLQLPVPILQALSDEDLRQQLRNDSDSGVRMQFCLKLGDVYGKESAATLGKLLRENFNDQFIRNAALSSLYATPPGFSISNIEEVLNEALNVPPDQLNEKLIGMLLGQAAAMGRGEALVEPLTLLIKSIDADAPAMRFERIAETVSKVLRTDVAPMLKLHKGFEATLGDAGTIALNVAKNTSNDADRRSAALRFADVSGKIDASNEELNSFLTPQTPTALQMGAVRIIARSLKPEHVSKLLEDLKTFEPAVHTEILTLLLQRDSTAYSVLDAVADKTLTGSDFDATQLDSLLHHRNEAIAKRAMSLLSGDVVSSRAAVIDDFKSQISNLKSEVSKEEQAAAGKRVFEKRCGTCHKLQDVGKEVGADLAALKDRSTDALLTAILDPNKAVESKFLVYTVVTKDGLQHSGMLKGETGGSLTLIGNDGKEITVVRADIEELMGSQRSLMPEGLEKDLSAVDLANVIAFVQSTGTPWKRFDGNAPKFVGANADGTVTLPASAAEIYGPSLIFEEKYGNLGYWTSADDYARWTFEVPKSGHWTVEFDFACDDSNAGSLIKFSTGNRMLTARVPGSGTWDNYQTWQAGTIDLHRGRGQLIITAPEKPPFALIDLRAVRLIPPK